MGITKTEGFKPEVNEMAELLKAIGHPARFSIMQFLAASPSCICGDIVDEIPLAQPTISRHLAELKRVGLIQGSITGKNICYCIDDKVWGKISSSINEIQELLNSANNCC